MRRLLYALQAAAVVTVWLVAALPVAHAQQGAAAPSPADQLISLPDSDGASTPRQPAAPSGPAVPAAERPQAPPPATTPVDSLGAPLASGAVAPGSASGAGSAEGRTAVSPSAGAQPQAAAQVNAAGGAADRTSARQSPDQPPSDQQLPAQQAGGGQSQTPRVTTSAGGAPAATPPAQLRTAQPQATQPQATQPQATQPQATQPQAAQPQAAQPQAAPLVLIPLPGDSAGDGGGAPAAGAAAPVGPADSGTASAQPGTQTQPRTDAPASAAGNEAGTSGTGGFQLLGVPLRPAGSATGDAASGAQPQAGQAAAGPGVGGSAQPAPSTSAPGADGQGSPMPPASGQAAPSETAGMTVAPMAGSAKAEIPPGGREIFAPLVSPQAGLAARVMLTGQVAQREFDLVLPDDLPVKEAVFRLLFQNSIELLPEGSRLTLSINGEEILTTPLTAYAEYQEVRAPVPRTALQAGRNTVRIEVTQRHRVLCSVSSVYELWTRIDGAGSGLELITGGPLPAPALAQIDSLLASSVTAPDGLNIIAPAGPPDATWVTRASLVAQGYGLRMLAGTPRVGLVEQSKAAEALKPGSHGGLVAAFGTTDELRGMVPDALLGQIRGPYVGVGRPGGPDSAALLLFSGRDGGEVSQAVARWALGAPNLPPLPAPQLPAPVVGPTTVTLKEMGLPTSEVWALRQRLALKLRLPDDFFAANDSVARLRLDYAYAPGLRPGSEMTVQVNGVTEALIRFNDVNGAIVNDRRYDLALRNFRPGMNDIVFEVSLPVATIEGGFCPPGGQNIDTTPRFTLFGNSSITFPEWARLGSIPHLGLFALDAYPYLPGQNEALLQQNPEAAVDLYLPARDRATVGAGLTVAANLAASSGQPLNLVPLFDGLLRPGRQVIAVGPVAAFSPGLFARSPLEQNQILQAWANMPQPEAAKAAEEGRRDTEAATATQAVLQQIQALRRAQGQGAAGQPAEERRLPGAGDQAQAPADDSVRQAWAERITESQPSGENDWLAMARSRAEPLLAATRAFFWRIVGGGEELLRSEPSIDFLQRSQPALVVQFLAPGASARAVTMVTAPDPDVLLASVYRLVEPSIWDQLRLAVVTWGQTPESVEAWSSGVPRHLWDGDPDPRNIYLIIENWLSYYPVLWVGCVLVTVFVLGASTYYMLRIDRRRRGL